VKWRKLLTILGIALASLLPALAVGWIYVSTESESPAIEQAINSMLYRYKYDDAERAYASMVPVKRGGRISLEEIRSAMSRPDLEFETYQSVEVEVLRVIPWLEALPSKYNEAIVRVILTYESECQIPFIFKAYQIDDEWKVYTLSYKDMSVFEVRACVEGK